MEIHSFKAKLFSPLFYSSSEGRTIKTRKILSATALSHAIAYRYFDLEKKYVLTGEEAITPDYSYLDNLPFIVSDMDPTDNVSAKERTFRSTDYRSDRYITTNTDKVAKGINGKKSVPDILEKSGAAWQTVREYIGISPMSEFNFTICSSESLPENLSFRMGIKQTGEFRASKTNLSEVTLNKYMLKNVYNVDKNTLTELTEKCKEFKRGNDPRLQHFVGVPFEKAKKVMKNILR